ncbi:hypothetical protein R0137_06395 [Congregibacter brevis]|uniref:Uncharacterized protein n=1 Tax=Congregibacter brevis TaxID=3081201 RepID=A0ABZ0IJG3_9GAMM|nr:hypothetical protein R0137_06395 [Congregibacter sp. IMCC45268]
MKIEDLENDGHKSKMMRDAESRMGVVEVSLEPTQEQDANDHEDFYYVFTSIPVSKAETPGIERRRGGGFSLNRNLAGMRNRSVLSLLEMKDPINHALKEAGLKHVVFSMNTPAANHRKATTVMEPRVQVAPHYDLSLATAEELDDLRKEVSLAKDLILDTWQILSNKAPCENEEPCSLDSSNNDEIHAFSETALPLKDKDSVDHQDQAPQEVASTIKHRLDALANSHNWTSSKSIEIATTVDATGSVSPLKVDLPEKRPSDTELISCPVEIFIVNSKEYSVSVRVDGSVGHWTSTPKELCFFKVGRELMKIASENHRLAIQSADQGLQRSFTVLATFKTQWARKGGQFKAELLELSDS